MSARKSHSGYFTPTNSIKYVGTYPIHWRSTWERTVMEMLDTNPNILRWASESLRIPYLNPFTNKHTVYVPDFLVYYIDGAGVKHTELIEVKPAKETFAEAAKSKRDKASQILNTHKWAAAMAYAARNGMTFRVMNESDIYRNPTRNR